MKHIILGEGAEQDLLAIVSHYETAAPASLQAVLDDIYAAISILILFPNAGAHVPGEHYRRIVSTKYRFKVGYLQTETEVIVIGIIRHQARAF